MTAVMRDMTGGVMTSTPGRDVRAPVDRRRAAWRAGAGCLAALAAVVLPALAQAQWLQGGYDAAKSGANTGETTLTRQNVPQLSLTWLATLGQFYVGPTTQIGGRVFACSNLHGLSALSPITGLALWDQPTAGVSLCGTPTLKDATAYVTSYTLAPSYRNVLTAVNQADGSVLWSTDGPAGSQYLGYSPQPAVVGNRLFLSTNRSGVFALDTANGAVVWENSTGASVLNNDASVAGGRVFVSTWESCCGTSNRRVYAYDAATGLKLWDSETDASNSQYPALALGKRVFAGSDSGKVFAYRAADGQLLWQRQLSGYISAPLTARTDSLFVASANSTIQALDVKNGLSRWTRVLGSATGGLVSNMVWANGMLFMTTYSSFTGEHRLLVLNAANGNILKTPATTSMFGSHSNLTVVEGRVHVSTDYGYLYVFGLNP